MTYHLITYELEGHSPGSTTNTRYRMTEAIAGEIVDWVINYRTEQADRDERDKDSPWRRIETPPVILWSMPITEDAYARFKQSEDDTHGEYMISWCRR